MTNLPAPGMDTYGIRAIGPGETTTITGSQACGFYRLKSDFSGPLDGGVGAMAATFGTPVTGDLLLDSTAELTMDLATSELGFGAAIGKAAISFITPPAGTSAPAFTIPTPTIRGTKSIAGPALMDLVESTGDRPPRKKEPPMRGIVS
jgi:hypothetical protein